MNPAVVYIVTNYLRTVLYIGVTTDLAERIQQHRAKSFDGFTAKYNCHFLIYAEAFSDLQVAIAREKQLKSWRREKKEWLISEVNPLWYFIEPDEMLRMLHYHGSD